MAITIQEAMKLNAFKHFRLIAGMRGLENEVTAVGIMDHEFDKDKNEAYYKGQFLERQFIVSSLLFAKEDPSLLLKSLKYLINDKVSGLAIKNIYYRDLPQEVLDLANDNAFPLFIFEEGFFEDIITEIMDRIRFVDNYEALENKISQILRADINRCAVRDIAHEINDRFESHFFCLYCRYRKQSGKDKLIQLLDRIHMREDRPAAVSFLKYRNGILVISSYPSDKRPHLGHSASALLEHMGLEPSDFAIGVGNLHTNWEDLGQGIREALFASKHGQSYGIPLCSYHEIGIHKILIPYASDIWMKSYAEEIVAPLREYDKQHQTELFHTACHYVDCDGSIKETAAALFIHENTIRFRIGRIKTILGMENLEGGFFEQLSIGIKLHRLNEAVML